MADASEWPIKGMVPRKRGVKYFVDASRRISIIGFSVPVCLRKARCCFSIIRTCVVGSHMSCGPIRNKITQRRTGLMNGADRMDAAVAAAKPGSPPSPLMYE